MSLRPFAVVDFPDPESGVHRRQLFASPSRIHVAETLDEVRSVLDAADAAARAGAWVVGYVSYEAAPAFDSALATFPRARLPLARFAEFPQGPQPYQPIEKLPTVDARPLAPRTEVTGQRYEADVSRIREYIAAGDVYQVNYTVPFRIDAPDDPAALYEALRDAQRGAYSACLTVGDVTIMSASPELFFERRGQTVRMRPMKGTAPRGLGNAADAEARSALLASEKDRAENVMIVDLVRNDLGRIARTGSVKVTSLCDAERYPWVWQLTSTVQGDVNTELPLADIFSALFPCGSITGAPKVRAMEIIRELEQAPREIYCGTVGVIAPGGDATFNVAIRTAWTSETLGYAQLNAGGAITLDSTPAGELSEVHDKLSAFTIPRPVPTLFETMRFERGVALRVGRHLARLRASAEYHDITFDAELAKREVERAAREHTSTGTSRARLVLTPDGERRITVEPFTDGDTSVIRPVALAGSPVSRSDHALYHKGTDRRLYDEALAARPGMFDVLLWNEEGDATEFTRGNLVARIGGVAYTPPESCGLLPGTLRGELRESGEIVERVLPVSELGDADSLWFINALRGWIPVRLVAHADVLP